MMFSLFKKKSEKEILEAKHKKLLEDAFKLSAINRKESDSKYAEADALLRHIENL